LTQKGLTHGKMKRMVKRIRLKTYIPHRRQNEKANKFNNNAEKNIIRALKNDFRITIFYVYQDPKIAWDFTRKIELADGRYVPKETFIHAFFKKRENIEKVKERHPEVILHIMIKDYQNNIYEVHFINY
jgi:hypothetical protein